MFKDKFYLQSLMKIGVPIALQQLLFASFSLLDTMMMGQMGENAIVAVGLSNQVGFVYHLIIFGITNGASIFSAQFWGVKDIKGIHKVMHLSLILCVVAGLLFTVVAVFFPELALSFYTEDPDVIRLGAEYLRIIGFSYLIMGIYFTFVTMLRTTHHVKLPTTISIVALAINMLLNYTLIFGKFGMPELGVRGAAIGTLVVRIFELSTLVLIVYLRKLPAAVSLKSFRDLKWSFVKIYLKTTGPVLINETIWSLAITTIFSIYARISTESVAAISIADTVNQFFFVLVIGIANATGILIGNTIGAGKTAIAIIYAKRSVFLSAGISLFLGFIIIIAAPTIVSIYNISEQTSFYAIRVIQIMGCLLWCKAMLVNWVIGVLRPGGDTRFTLIVDGVIIWVVGVSMAYLGANILKLPIYWVYLMVASEEVIKNILCWFRFRSRKWINVLTEKPVSPMQESLVSE